MSTSMSPFTSSSVRLNGRELDELSSRLCGGGVYGCRALGGFNRAVLSPLYIGMGACEAATAAMLEFRKEVTDLLPVLRAKIQRYLALNRNTKTRFFLASPVFGTKECRQQLPIFTLHRPEELNRLPKNSAAQTQPFVSFLSKTNVRTATSYRS